MVLVLSTLHNLLTQMLALPELHTAILLTTEGQLISVASDPSRPKDKARILAGVSGEIYQETKDQGFGMVESELGRTLVMPVAHASNTELSAEEPREPLLILALNSTDAVEWQDLQQKAKTLVDHLAPSVDKFRDHSRPAKSSITMASPDRPTR